MTPQERAAKRRRVQQQLNSAKSALRAKEAEKRMYEQKSRDISSIVSRLNGIKGKISAKSAQARSMVSTPNAGFAGYLYNSVYVPSLNSITSGYQAAIGGIGANVGLLNQKKTEFDKKAKACEGPIRNLKARVQSLSWQLANC